MMGKKIRAILQPKASGLSGKDKPVALIVSSPYDEVESATSLKGKQKQLESDGFGSMNKKAVFFDSDPSDLESSVKFSTQIGGHFTIVVNAHGAPGWFFGGIGTAKSEMKGLLEFGRMIRAIEQHTGKTFENIVIGGCYSAVEMYNQETGQYMNSPARLLSMIFPDKNVVGFIGQYADAKVTKIYTENKGEFSPVIKNPDEAGVLFRGGNIIERPTDDIYCTHVYTPKFIKGHLGLGAVSGKDYFKPTFVHEDSDNISGFWLNTEDNLGSRQIKTIPAIQEHLLEENDLGESSEYKS